MKKLLLFLCLLLTASIAGAQCDDFDDTTFTVTPYGPDSVTNAGVAIDLDPVAGATAYQAFFIPIRWTTDSTVSGIIAKNGDNCGARFSDVFTDTMLYISQAWNFNGYPGDEYYVFITATGPGIDGCVSNVFRITSPNAADYTNPYTQTPGASLPCTTAQTKVKQTQNSAPNAYPIRKNVK